jgi:hypothetical protein
MKHFYDTLNNDFRCKHCKNFVSTDPSLSGVNNRNHCPYCLWSRHMDWQTPGDRLSACNGCMKPIGLTLKRINKKYGRAQGELMLIHVCEECSRVSINRTAADDMAQAIIEIFNASLYIDASIASLLHSSGIQPLGPKDEMVVRSRLFGLDPQQMPQYRFA